MKCRFCEKKYNNSDIVLCHEAACQNNPANIDKNQYDMYRQAQEFRFRPERSAHHSGTDRKKNFINIIKNCIAIGESALTIGCANTEEIQLLKNIGFKNAIGIDLCPNFPGIVKMDMHDIKYDNNSFDFILLSHSLEHAFDFKKVIQECDRVLKNGGYIAIEVPVNYIINDVDRIDFKNSETLIAHINNIMKITRVYAKDIKHKEKDNYCATDISRVIVRKI